MASVNTLDKAESECHGLLTSQRLCEQDSVREGGVLLESGAPRTASNAKKITQSTASTISWFTSRLMRSPPRMSVCDISRASALFTESTLIGVNKESLSMLSPRGRDAIC